MASSQDMVRVGSPIDLFYYDADTMKKQAHSTTQNTRFQQSFNNTNLTGGSSTFTFPPTNGLQDVVLAIQLPNIASNMTGVNLGSAWGYGLIRQVSFRYGGSSQYFLQGSQLLELAISAQPNRESAQAIVDLGGTPVIGDNAAGLYSSWNNPLGNYAYVVLTLPHSSPSAVGKSHPFPTDLLTQLCQFTVELNPLNSLTSTTTAGLALENTAFTANPTYASAVAQFQQVMLNNQGDALARRMDMSVNAYAFPCTFVQQLFQSPLPSASNTSQSISLTGFKAGEVKEIHIWLTDTASSVGAAVAGVNNPNWWYLPQSITMTYAGDIYARFENRSSQIWNLVNGNKPNYVVLQGFSGGAGNALTTQTAPVAAATGASPVVVGQPGIQWVVLPFAQTLVDEDSHYTLVHGKPITNGIVQLQITPPYTTTGQWVVNVSYVLNSTLLMSMGTADFVF